MIRSRRLRRAFFGLWGGAEVLYDLDEVVRAASGGLSGPADPLLDVPCGQGVVAELLAQDGWTGRLVGLDLAQRAVDLAAARATQLPAGVDTKYVQGSALDLPFDDDSIGAIVSINGLHVMPDHQQFLDELARVLRPGRDCWLITPVTGRGIRASFMLRAGLRLGVLTQRPPTIAALESLAIASGFTVSEHLGGTNIVGLRLTRVDTGVQ